MGKNEGIRIKLFFRILLILEALLIIIQLAAKHEAWVSMMCFWSIVAMDNILDIIDERKNKDGGHGSV